MWSSWIRDLGSYSRGYYGCLKEYLKQGISGQLLGLRELERAVELNENNKNERCRNVGSRFIGSRG